MPRQTVDLVKNEIYHISYRAVGDSTIFNDTDDHYRAIFSLYEFNDSNPKTIWLRRKQRKAEKKLALRSPSPHQVGVVPERDNFVDILAFCLMPNHIHLLMKQLAENGISKFIQKIGGGYASYFNGKYERKGHLFNQFKAIHVKDDNQLRNTVTYIHCNPISLIEPNWKEREINNPKKVLGFLENGYRWSSLWDYLGKPNFVSVASKKFLIEAIGRNAIQQDIKKWIQHKANLKEAINAYKDLFLE